MPEEMKFELELHLADVRAIREGLNLPLKFTDQEIEDMYTAYCTKEYCANWLTISPHRIELFGKWIIEGDI